MPISDGLTSLKKACALWVAAALIGVAALLAHAPNAHAFDPEKVFKEEKPSAKKLFRFYLKKRKEGQDDEAIDVLQYAADQGNQTAQWTLGRMYESGDTVPRDPARAFAFYKRIADNFAEARPGTPEWAITGKAMVALGHYYANGVPEANIRQDNNEARVMFTTAAMYFRDADGQFELARLLLQGENSPEEARQAIRMLQLARKKGHVGAMALLGHALVEGTHVEQDVVRGLTMLTKANASATPDMAPWIDQLHQSAFALASVEERNAAITAVQSQ